MAVRAEQQRNSWRRREQGESTGSGMGRMAKGCEDPLMSVRCGAGKGFPPEKLK